MAKDENWEIQYSENRKCKRGKIMKDGVAIE
jgi:hypothetical protein